MPPIFYLLKLSIFNGNNHYIIEVREHVMIIFCKSQVFAVQMAAPQLILMAEIDMLLQQQALIEFLVTEGSSQLAFMNIYSKCIMKLLWM